MTNKTESKGGKPKDIRTRVKEMKRKLHPRSAAKRSELREKANLGLSTGSLLLGAASIALALNRKSTGIDRGTGEAGSEPHRTEDMRPYGPPARQYAGYPAVASRNNNTRLRQLTPQDIESSCRGKGVRYVILKASGGNIGTLRYKPGSAEAFLSQYGHLGYWKKERVGDSLYYFLGN